MGNLKDISWHCLKCPSYKSMDNCYRCENDNGLFPSWSNITWSLPIIKNIKSIFLDIEWWFESKQFEKYYINEYETETMKHIWGIKSWDDLSKSDGANLWTMNDFDLTYLKDEDKYVMGVETIYLFKDAIAERNYIIDIFTQFTKWMEENGYDTTKEPSIIDIFTYGININSKFDSIEDAYMAFKYFAIGFVCSDVKELSRINKEEFGE